MPGGEHLSGHSPEDEPDTILSGDREPEPGDWQPDEGEEQDGSLEHALSPEAVLLPGENAPQFEQFAGGWVSGHLSVNFSFGN